MAFEQTYKGHKIDFIESTDQWRCEDLNITVDKLSTLKKKLDDLSKTDRKLDIECLLINSSWDKTEAKKVRVTIICEPRYKEEGPKDCWVVDGKKNREKVNISSLIQLGAEGQINEWIEADKAATAAEKHAKKLQDELPRHTAKSLLAAGKAGAK